jgi:hypothetical protein
MAVGSTLDRVLSSLPDDKKLKLHEYQKDHAFHRGRQWFGFGMRVARSSKAPGTKGPSTASFALSAMEAVACPVAAAFDVKRDTSKNGWFSARLDENLLAAIKHIIGAAGNAEDGMEEYLKELENTDPIELYQLVEAHALKARAPER